MSAEKVTVLIEKAQQFDVKDVVTDPDCGSNASDDAVLSVPEDHPDDQIRSELTAIIRSLKEDEQIDLVALAWLGRRDGELEDWDDIRAEATRVRNKHTAELRGPPFLGDHLEEALTQFGHSVEKFRKSL